MPGGDPTIRGEPADTHSGLASSTAVSTPAANRPGLRCCQVPSCLSPTSQDGAPLLACTGCRFVAYCCKDHQKLDWKTHKLFCLNAGKDAPGVRSSAEIRAEEKEWMTEALTPEQRAAWHVMYTEVEAMHAEFTAGSQAVALEKVRAAVSNAECLYGRGTLATIPALFTLSDMLDKRGLYDDALPYTLRVLKMVDDRFGANDARVVDYLRPYVRLLAAIGRNAESLVHAERNLAIVEGAMGRNDVDVAACLTQVVNALRALNRPVEGVPLCRRALAIFGASLGADHRELGVANLNLGSILISAGDHAGARPHTEAAMVAIAATQGRQSTAYAACCGHLASIHAAVGAGAAAALPLQSQRTRILESRYGEHNAEVLTALHDEAAMAAAVASDAAGWRVAVEKTGRLARLMAEEYGAGDARTAGARTAAELAVFMCAQQRG